MLYLKGQGKLAPDEVSQTVRIIPFLFSHLSKTSKMVESDNDFKTYLQEQGWLSSEHYKEFHPEVPATWRSLNDSK